MVRSATGFIWALAILMLMLVITIPAIDRAFFSDATDPAAAHQQIGQSSTVTGTTSRTPVTTEAVQRKLDDADQNLDEALRLNGVWDVEIAPLESGPAGQTIAQNEELSGLMAHIFATGRPTADELAVLRQRGDDLRRQFAGQGGESGSTVPAELQEAISQWHADTAAVHETLRRVVSGAEAIVRQADRLATGEADPVDAGTLAQSMQASHDDETLAQVRRDVQRDQKRKLELEQQAELELKAQSPEVLGALSPFVTPRTSHPQLSGASVIMTKSFEEQPMSLSWLKQIGALDPSVDGLKMLARVGAARKLPEPRWTFPTQPNNWSPETEASLKDAQQMLRDYGPALVRLGKLSP